MTDKTKKVVIYSIICIILVFGFIRGFDIVGLPASHIEQDARDGRKIDSTWEAAKSVNDKLGVVLLYNDSLDKYNLSIYLNRDGFSLGYFFWSGTSGGDLDGVRIHTTEANGSALVSMNKEGVARIDLDDGNTLTHIDIDPTKPFAVVLPANFESVTLYDENENTVPIT